jgi:hypothetical protein
MFVCLFAMWCEALLRLAVDGWQRRQWWITHDEWPIHAVSLRWMLVIAHVDDDSRWRVSMILVDVGVDGIYDAG